MTAVASTDAAELVTVWCRGEIVLGASTIEIPAEVEPAEAQMRAPPRQVHLSAIPASVVNTSARKQLTVRPLGRGDRVTLLVTRRFGWHPATYKAKTDHRSAQEPGSYPVGFLKGLSVKP